jgi:hypothetical protein
MLIFEKEKRQKSNRVPTGCVIQGKAEDVVAEFDPSMRATFSVRESTEPSSYRY